MNRCTSIVIEVGAQRKVCSLDAYETVAVLDAAERVCGSREQARTWFHNEPIDVFDYQTAEQLVSAGRTDDLLHYLRLLEAGPAGYRIYER